MGDHSDCPWQWENSPEGSRGAAQMPTSVEPWGGPDLLRTDWPTARQSMPVSPCEPLPNLSLLHWSNHLKRLSNHRLIGQGASGLTFTAPTGQRPRPGDLPFPAHTEEKASFTKSKPQQWSSEKDVLLFSFQLHILRMWLKCWHGVNELWPRRNSIWFNDLNKETGSNRADQVLEAAFHTIWTLSLCNSAHLWQWDFYVTVACAKHSSPVRRVLMLEMGTNITVFLWFSCIQLPFIPHANTASAACRLV